MSTLDNQAASHFRKKLNKAQTHSSPSPHFPPSSPTSKPGKEKLYPMNMRTGTNIHASCPDVRQSSFTTVRNISMH